MTCPYCGNPTTVEQGRCSSCNGVLGPPVATTVLTPVPPPQKLIDSEATCLPPSAEPRQETPASTIDVDAATALSPSSMSEKTGSAARGALQGGAGPLVPGQPFGARYQIIRPLGAGGMGVVYQAWDDALGVAVAIKVIRPDAIADPIAAAGLERRFKRELLLARQVTHKNVVRIHDLGEIDGIKYITMPYIQGSDLATTLKRQGKLPVARALAIAQQIASGLVAAHEVGVVHRDLKPENIMIEDDCAIIMDFGIASSASTSAGTIAGGIVGTLGYMAPEQALGQSIDQRADVYSFGLILYDMLLGRGRHTSGTQTPVAELMNRIQRAPRARSTPTSHPPSIRYWRGVCSQIPRSDTRRQQSCSAI